MEFGGTKRRRAQGVARKDTYWYALGGVVALSMVCVLAPRVVEYSSMGRTMLGAVLPAAITEETNLVRAGLNESGLVYDEQLAVAAQAKAEDMITRHYFAHTSPEGLPPWHWLDAAGYDYTYAGENLAAHFNESSEVVRAWVASPEHYKNLIKPEYTQIGVGVASGMLDGVETTVVVQFFAAKPATQPAVVARVVEAVTPVAEARAVTVVHKEAAPDAAEGGGAAQPKGKRVNEEQQPSVLVPTHVETPEVINTQQTQAETIVLGSYVEPTALEYAYNVRYEISLALLLALLFGIATWYMAHHALHGLHVPHLSHGTFVLAGIALAFVAMLGVMSVGVALPTDVQYAAVVHSL